MKQEDGTTLTIPQKKHNDIFITINDAKETIYNNQTGAFPTRSRSGIRYIMIMCEMDGNAIMSEGLRNRTVGEIIKVYQKLILTKSRHTPKETHVGQRVNRRIQTSNH